MPTESCLSDLFPRFHHLGRCAVLISAGLFWPTAQAQAAETPSKGQVILEADFESADSAAAPASGQRYEAGWQSPRALCVESRAGADGSSPSVRLRLPAQTLRGCTLRGSAMVKADGVSAKPNPWNGIKFMLAIETPDRKLWPQAALETGTFAWKRAVFTTKVPADASAVTLMLGLEQVTGSVCFDDVKITVAKTPVSAKPAPAPGVAFTGREVPRLRGARSALSFPAPFQADAGFAE